MSLRVVTEGLQFPEGPVPMPDGSVLVVEIDAGRLTRVAPDGTKTVVAELGGGPNGAAIGPDGRCYVCNNGGHGGVPEEQRIPGETPEHVPPGCIQAVDLATGAFETLYASTEATPFWAPNDIVFDSAGGFWFTDFGRNRGRVRTRGALYYATIDGSRIEEMVFRGPEAPNGIGLSPDERTLYAADTFGSHLWAFTLSAPGVIDRGAGYPLHGGRQLGRSGSGRYLDSMAVEADGRICVASPGAEGSIQVFPTDGGPPETVPLPDYLATNIAFGGPDLRTAYITLSGSGQLVAMDWPRPGLKLAY